MTKNRKVKAPWPTKAVMEQIYDKKFWGGPDVDYYSGEGSHRDDIIQPYIQAVTIFLESKNNTLCVCDLGCGDFNIGQHLVSYAKKYIAVDIVDGLIQRNKELFKADHLEFSCLDIANDQLPKADCIILRQVLQHLSNTEIKKILDKIHNYKYLILTEHVPAGTFNSNEDKIAGQGIRLKQNSGVDVLAEPFNLQVISSQLLDEFFMSDNKGKIVTILFNLS